MINSRIDAYCKCGCQSGFLITFRFEDDEDFAYITSVTSGFYAGQRGIWETIKHRVKAAWFMLCGKEYCLHDVVLSKEQWKEFVEAANAIGKEATN